MVEPSNPEETRRICISIAPTKKILMHTVPEGSLISSFTEPADNLEPLCNQNLF